MTFWNLFILGTQSTLELQKASICDLKLYKYLCAMKIYLNIQIVSRNHMNPNEYFFIGKKGKLLFH